jgi:uncharacterized membrane protein
VTPLARRVGVGLALAALTALVGLAVWPRLPSEVAIHFTAGGTPDNYVSRMVGVLLLPALMVATLAVLEGALRADPPADPRTPTVVVVATMAFMTAIQGLVLAWNLGYAVDFSLVLVGSLVWAALVCGYAVRREGLSV